MRRKVKSFHQLCNVFSEKPGTFFDKLTKKNRLEVGVIKFRGTSKLVLTYL